MKRKLMSVFLALVLALSLLPAAAFAEEDGQEDLPQLEDALPEEQERNDEDENHEEDSAHQNSEGVLSEGYPSPAPEDGEAEDPAVGETPEEPEDDLVTVTAEFITSGPDTVSSQSGLRRAQSRAVRAAGTGDFGSQLESKSGAPAKAVYEKLVTAFANGPDETEGTTTVIDLSGDNATLANCRDALAAFDRDYSEVFWLGLPSISYNPDTNVAVSLTFDKSDTWNGGRNIKSDYDAAIQAAEKLAGDAQKASSDNQYLQLKYVHDWLVNQNAYNETAAGTQGYSDETPWEAISAFDSKLSPVCEGYARAFKMVCDKLNIPCVLVSGTGTNSSGKSEAHMWNYVQLDGAWYMVDVTWDDPLTATGDQVLRFTYFLVGSTTDGGKHSNGTQFISINNTYNCTFDYPQLSTTDYDYLTALGVADISITAKPEPTKTVSSGTVAYEVPEGGTLSIKLTAKLVDGSGQEVSAPTFVGWGGVPSGITLVDNGDNTATITLPSTGLSTNTYTHYDQEVSFGAALKKSHTINYTQGEPTPASKVTISCDSLSPGADGKYVVEIPATGSSTIAFTATESPETSAQFAWSVDSKDTTVQFNELSSGSLTVFASAQPGEYTVTATSTGASGASASVTVVLKRAAAAPTTGTYTVQGDGFRIPEPGHIEETNQGVVFRVDLKDQFNQSIPYADWTGITLKATVAKGGTDVSSQFAISFNGPEIILRAKDLDLAEGDYTVTPSWEKGGVSHPIGEAVTLPAERFDVSWPDQTEIELFPEEAGKTPTYGQTLNQLLVVSGAGKKNPVFTTPVNGSWHIPGKFTLKGEDGNQLPTVEGTTKYTLVYTSDNGLYVREKEFTYSRTVSPRTVYLQIESTTIIYGTAVNPNEFAVTPSNIAPGGTGLVDSADLSTLKYTLTLRTDSGGQTVTSSTPLPGKYTIAGAQAADSNPNYKLWFMDGTLTVEKAPATLSFAGSTTVSLSDLTANKDSLGSLPGLPDKVKVTYGGKTVEATPQIAWASKGSSVADVLKQFADNESLASATAYLTAAITLPEELAKIVTVTSNTLEYPVLVTGKNVATITPKGGLDLSKTYDGLAVAKPSASDFTITGKDGAALTPGADEFTVSFRVKGGSEIEAPKDKGDYTLVVTFANNDYLGTYEADFTISPLEATLTWAGAGARTYDGTASNVTATVGNLVSDDAVTVTVTGGTEKNAGSYTATASGLAGAAAGNYVLPESGLTQEYTINRAPRSVKPASMVLLPGSLTGKLVVDGLIDADKDSAEDKKLTIGFKAGADNTLVALNGATGEVTGLKNGKTTLVVSAAETTNYQAIAATDVAVTVVVEPVLGATATTGEAGDQLVAALEGTTVKVTGFVADADQAITVTLTLADGLGLTQTPNADGSTITVKASDGTSVGTYTVVKKIEVVGPNLKIEEAQGTASVPENVPAEVKDKLQSTASGLAPEASGLSGAASNELLEAGKKALEEAPENTEITVEAKLVVAVKDYVSTGEKTLKLEITPQYTVKIGNGAASAPKPITSLAAPVEVKIKLTNHADLFSNMLNVYVRHHLKSGGIEILKPKWDSTNTILSWFQGSFSEFDITEDGRKGTITFKNGEQTQTIEYTYEDLDKALPASGHKDGWKYGDKTYTKLTDELLTAIAGKTVELTPAATVTPPVNPGRPGGNTPSTPSTPSGGSSSSSSSSGTPGTIYTSSSSSGGSYSVSASKPSNGSVSLSSSSARPGATVTITPKPNKGYELDTLTVLDKDGSRVQVREKDGKYTFTMPKGKVSVEATFRPIGESGTPAFADLPAGYWAENAILWASQNGYMNGTSSTTFNPDGIITRQQMWMILARLNGRSPADFAEARAWAMETGVSDGTNGGSAMSRQQMVTFLHRYGQMKGYALTGSTELGNFPDGSAVSGYAQEPLSWAVANGIVNGTSQGTLNPGGTATRAQFAVILQRFYQNVVEA